MKSKHAIIFVSLLMCHTAICSAADDLARFIVIQNMDSRAKLDSFGYKFQRTYEELQGLKRTKAILMGEWRQTGKMKWIDFERHSKYSDDPRDTQDSRMLAFVGAHSSGTWVQGTINPLEILHDDIDHPSDRERVSTYIHFQGDPMYDAFGFGGERPLDVEKLEAIPSLRWTGIKDAPSHAAGLYVLTRDGDVQGKTVHDAMLELDPTRGWLVIRCELYGPTGRVWRETTVTPAMSSDGVWYPQRVRTLAYDLKSGEPKTSEDLVISDFHLVRWADAQYSVAALKLADGSHLQRLTQDGKHEVFVSKNNELTVYERPTPARHIASARLRRSLTRWIWIGGGVLALAIAAGVLPLVMHYKRR